MAYSTVPEVKTVLSGFVDPAPQDPDIVPSKLSDAQIEYEIKNADAQIDAAVRRHYNLPLPEPVHPLLNVISVDIAAAQCDLIFRGSREYATILAPLRLRYERAKLLLDGIASGDFPLYNEGEGPEGVGGAIVINPYPTDILLTNEVFAHGGPFNGRSEEGAEMTEIPYNPYLRYWR